MSPNFWPGVWSTPPPPSLNCSSLVPSLPRSSRLQIAPSLAVAGHALVSDFWRGSSAIEGALQAQFGPHGRRPAALGMLWRGTVDEWCRGNTRDRPRRRSGHTVSRLVAAVVPAYLTRSCSRRRTRTADADGHLAQRVDEVQLRARQGPVRGRTACSCSTCCTSSQMRRGRGWTLGQDCHDMRSQAGPGARPMLAAVDVELARLNTRRTVHTYTGCLPGPVAHGSLPDPTPSRLRSHGDPWMWSCVGPPPGGSSKHYWVLFLGKPLFKMSCHESMTKHHEKYVLNVPIYLGKFKMSVHDDSS
ncbi:hypothetical protein GGX14DRAFT_385396 [Mycena pura]|uniref:Uncharacterized protein n=1 Tax=Mycena pura TaxID=153505 RepID=A0AAD6YUL9_9AGAR|nr:hypothetical protein GGX14DRAFT_385396 [Mycena pura]